MVTNHMAHSTQSCYRPLWSSRCCSAAAREHPSSWWRSSCSAPEAGVWCQWTLLGAWKVPEPRSWGPRSCRWVSEAPGNSSCPGMACKNQYCHCQGEALTSACWIANRIRHPLNGEQISKREVPPAHYRRLGLSCQAFRTSADPSVMA